MKFKEIGWNGFLLRVPEDMYLARHGGDSRKGGFLIESEDSLIEVSWIPISKKRSASLLEVVDKITDRIQKEVGKKKLNFAIKERRDTIVNNHKAVYLLLDYGFRERYYVWRCPDSNRIVAVRFLFRKYDERTSEVIRNVIGTIKCHGKKHVWSLMKMRFETPKTFLLNTTEIKAAELNIALSEEKFSMFEERRKAIYVKYFPMANIRFKDTYRNLERWFEKNYMNEFKKKILKIRGKMSFKIKDEKKLGDHTVLIEEARLSSKLIKRRKEICSVAFWYCPEMNRIYFLALDTQVHRPPPFKINLKADEHEALFNEVLDSFRCH
ncbi:hypothetical protein J7K07_05185 [Candidatus Bathyarchaeota archaeon]|nr:hypothetical protein [Candidatus Bathyarchaeota archaeon]